jgi:hypothetical protein
MIGMFTTSYGNKENEYSFKPLAIAVDACVPEGKRAEVLEQLEDQKRSIWQEIGMMPIWRIVGASFTLLIGWAVHTFLL